MTTTIESNITLSVRGGRVEIDDLNSRLQAQSVDGFQKGDVYLGKYRDENGDMQEVERSRSYGLWKFSTEGIVKSINIVDHVVFVLDKFEPVAPELVRLIGDPEYCVRLVIWHVSDYGFELESELWQRMAKLSQSISVTCWRVQEARQSD